MTKLTTTVLAILTCALFVSCQKEVSTQPPSETSAGITGNYKFVSEEVQSTVTLETKDGDNEEKTVTISHYISKDNSGTVKIEATTMASNNIAFTIDTAIKAYIYTNGILEDSSSVPFQFSIPASSSVAPYKIIGTDSIYFSSGSFVMDPSSSTSTPSASNPSGGKFKFDGDKLYLTFSISQTEIKEQYGLRYNSTSQARSIVILQKQ